MTTTEMKTKFATLYSIMANSRKISNMKLFGSVMRDMMSMLIENHPDVAEKYIDRLKAVKWNNYLTKEEAESICSRMMPPPHWNCDTLHTAVESIDGLAEDKPCYNCDALLVVMNMVYSDSAESIAEIIGRPLSEIPERQMTNAVYALATDKLCDDDGVFNVRTYFNADL